jgi:hypothetical protein
VTHRFAEYENEYAQLSNFYKFEGVIYSVYWNVPAKKVAEHSENYDFGGKTDNKDFIWSKKRKKSTPDSLKIAKNVEYEENRSIKKGRKFISPEAYKIEWFYNSLVSWRKKKRTT